ncbi:TetR/AcrR family transcriptional regulator [Actinomadura madurae]|uniref:TetR/AcrR family transcriptional regulator n=1 Tax=Actinomadura madurae TaxID=1993 RepID=UPI000D9283CD|nr:TetR/AcrR family transcriptional regulator [Actinomadura madurae]MCP9951251.1 TetR/AcrR family transcriptional regulator [Actinomadura madurae]MCP9968020.1 TetR/AcrR family transcriptional regulator [Actinomadura madurae]MCP9980477.1 TetR/AcrR family transcriptional regulator [Actinomadura madurae]MCQ0008005.1 TetR/AcrR family transcriptional regulator [Actinomadura madurae]MCQ0016679.1 TetR/AcrR family transcriptional regulator [Actinomadura madurae]
MSPRHSVAEAARTRERIVRAAVLDASRLGLEGLTVGTLARRLDMSKAGLVGPFGSRDRLLMAALDEAIEIFHAAVTAPLGDLPSGAERLGRFIDGWVDYLADCPFPGGCFLTAASCELDGRPGPLRERLREIVAAHRRALAAEVAAAQAELPGPHRPAEEVATALFGLSMAANQEIQLLQDPTAPARARAAMRHAAGLDPQGRSHG